MSATKPARAARKHVCGRFSFGAYLFTLCHQTANNNDTKATAIKNSVDCYAINQMGNR